MSNIAYLNWLKLSQDILSHFLDSDKVQKYQKQFADQLRDVTENFVYYDIPEMEEDAEEAARDAHIEQKIDEKRGK